VPISVMFGLAEIEMEYRRERQIAGIRLAKEAGVYKGRKKGTTKGKPERAQGLKRQGLSVDEIANAMGVGKAFAWYWEGNKLSAFGRKDEATQTKWYSILNFVWLPRRYFILRIISQLLAKCYCLKEIMTYLK